MKNLINHIKILKFLVSNPIILKYIRILTIIWILIQYFHSVKCEAQSLFQYTIGGTNNDYSAYIVKTNDGGYTVAGNTNSYGAGGYDVYIIKLNTNGVIQWSKTLGTAADEILFSITNTTDGGYAVACTTSAGPWGWGDILLIKLDASGVIQWNKILGGSSRDYPKSTIQTSDGGYALAGCTYSFGANNGKIYILKLNSAGTLQWNMVIGSQTNQCYANSIIQTSDGGYALAAVVGTGIADAVILKLDSNGAILWSKVIGGGLADYVNCIIQSTDNELVLAGSTASYGVGVDMWILKFDTNGTLLWNKTIGTLNAESAATIVQSSDGGFVAGGITSTSGYPRPSDLYIVKLDYAGNLQWSKTVGGNNLEYSRSLVQTSDGGYVVAGETNSFGAGEYDIYIVKFDANGSTCGYSANPQNVIDTGGATNSLTTEILSPNPGVSTIPLNSGTGGTQTTLCYVGIQTISTDIPGKYTLFNNYPNPFNPVTKIKFDIPPLSFGEGSGVRLIIYDILCREITTLVNERFSPGTYEVEWDGTNYPSGLYFYKLITAEYTATKRMVLIK